MRLQDLMDIMEEIAPAELAMDFDNSGLQCGNIEQPVRSILLALDCTDAVAEEAIAGGYDLILTHHPLIWNPLKCLDDGTRVGRILRRLIQADIALFAAHTNLDTVSGGVCDVLVDIFGMENVEKIQQDENGEGYARMGGIPETTVAALSETAKEKLRTTYVRYTGDGQRSVKRIGVASGSGSSCFQDALDKGVECIISGDVNYGQAVDYTAIGLSIIDAGHFATEIVVLPELIRRLQSAFDRLQYNADMKIAGTSSDAFTIV